MNGICARILFLLLLLCIEARSPYDSKSYRSDISLHKEIVHLFLLYIFVFLYKLTELFLDMSDDERINYISKIQLVVYYNYQCCVLIG